MFKSQGDRRGLGHGRFVVTEKSRKDLTEEVGVMMNEERIPHILSLAQQSKWLEWDRIVELEEVGRVVLLG